MPAKYSTRVILITWLIRILCGGLFIFSGFVKAIDPWGTIYKVQEYLGVFGFSVPFSLYRLGVFFLCAVEFVVGCFLLLGCFRKSCPVFAGLIMLFMLPLSLWVAMENPVAECGCFGDALYISNWFTFCKNIALVAGVAWLIRYNLAGICLVTPAFQWLAVVASGIFIVLIELVGYFYQPLIDFRGFKEESSFFASYDGEEEGGIDVFDVYTADDRNEEAKQEKGKEIVVMIPDISMVSPATTWTLNSIYEWAQNNNVKMIGIASGSVEEIEEWEDLSMAQYPLYLADDSSIKEAVRGNPGIIYLDDGKIVWKKTLYSIDADDFSDSDLSGDISFLGTDNARLLMNFATIYLIVMAFLVFISFTPRMASLLIRGGLASKKGVRHH